MSVPNIGPQLPDPSDRHGQDHARRGNPSLVYRDDAPTDDVLAASTRANVVTQRFGGVRYALSRPGLPFSADPGFETLQGAQPDDERPLFEFRLGWPWQARLDLPTDGVDGGESHAHD
jgi:hypothetical protein